MGVSGHLLGGSDLRWRQPFGVCGEGLSPPVHTSRHNYTLVKKQSRLYIRKYSFSQRTINVWNKLSTDCVHASSVNMFKNKIDKYLAKAGYT